jgi:hypothetical protein
MSRSDREAFDYACVWDDAIAEEKLRVLIKNQPGHVTVAPVVASIRNTLANWRFESRRVEVDAEPSQWASMLRAIDVPKEWPGYRRLEVIRVELSRLPPTIDALLSEHIFRQAQIGLPALFARIQSSDQESCLAAEWLLLSSAVDEVAQRLTRIRAKRGPRRNKGKYVKAVADAIRAASDLSEAKSIALAADLLSPYVAIGASRQNLHVVRKKRRGELLDTR